MYVEDELRRFLDGSIPSRSQTKARDIDIIVQYFGFGDLLWPTYEQLATKFDVTRERIRQIIRGKFQKCATLSDFPTTLKIAQLIESHDFVSSAELGCELHSLRLTTEHPNIKGILKLINDLGACSEHCVYNHNLEPVSRSEYSRESITFIIKTNKVDSIRSGLQCAKSLPGQLGLAQVGYIRNRLSSITKTELETVIDLVRASPDVCIVSVDSNDWYIFEDRDNTIINAAAKVFCVVDSCELKTLITALQRTLRRRRQDYQYPDCNALEQYIKRSPIFGSADEIVTFNNRRGILTELESEVVAYVRSVGETDFDTLERHLSQFGYDRRAIVQVVWHSPIVSVDKAGGRKSNELTFRQANWLLAVHPAASHIPSHIKRP